MILNRKGFTLIELLVTIVIIGLVVGLSTYGIIKLVNDSEEQTTVLNESNLKEAARIYSSEASSDSWKKTDENYDAFCVTIGELMNKGLLEKNAFINGGYTKDNFIIVKRNKITLAIENEEIVSNDTTDKNNKICTGQVNIGNEDVTAPSITGSTSYTDRIEVIFNTGESVSGVKNYTCLYGSTSSNINKEGVVEGNKCVLDVLKSNSQYYVHIYMNTNKGTSVLAEGNREYSTKDLVNTTIEQNQKTINISYNDNNIYENGYHYFHSNTNGTLGDEVQQCILSNNKFECSGSTTSIKENIWYKTNNDSVSISYSEENNNVTIKTKICDRSNNCLDNNDTFEITKNKVYIVYNVNGGSIATETNGNGERNWTTNSDGDVFLNGNNKFTSINFNENIGTNGLINYNNSDWLNISKTGYIAKVGAEWSCLSENCTKETYDQSIIYNSSDFCDASSSDCTVVLGVNWEVNTYYFDLNWIIDGTINYYAVDGLKAGIKLNGVDKGYTSALYEQIPYGSSWEIYSLELNGTIVSYSESGTMGEGITKNIGVNTLNIGVNNSSYGSVSASLLYVLPNTTYTTNSNTLSLSDGRTITANKIDVNGYTTTFSNWSPSSGTINSMTSITANFNRSMDNTVTLYVCATVNCRTSPNAKENNIKTTYEPGDTITGYSSENGWFYNSSNECYMDSSYLSTSPNGCSSSTLNSCPYGGTIVFVGGTYQAAFCEHPSISRKDDCVDFANNHNIAEGDWFTNADLFEDGQCFYRAST